MTLPASTPAPDASADAPAADAPVDDVTPVEGAPAEPAEPAVDDQPNVDVDDEDEFEEPGDESIPEELRGYVKHLRDREAKARIRARETAERFAALDRLDPADAQSFMLALEDVASGDPAAMAHAGEFFARVAGVLGYDLTPAGDTPGEPGDDDEDGGDVDLDDLDDDTPLTKGEVLRLLEKQRQAEQEAAEAAEREAAEKAAEAELFKTLADAGVPEHDQLKVLIYANEAGGDTTKAIARYQAEIEQIEKTAIQRFLASKQGEADATAPTAPSGAAPASKGAPMTDKERMAAAVARYQALTKVTE
jgi:hypothetical protein